MTKKTIRVWLECAHTLWFETPPRQGERIYCFKCQDYKIVGEPGENAETLHADYMWASRPIGVAQHKGVCRVKGCKAKNGKPYERRGTFEKLQAAMQVHHITEHTNSTLLKPRETKIVEKLPPNSSPPF